MKHGGMAMVVTRVILAQLHQLVAEKDVHATNVAWLRARTLVDGSPRYTFRAIRNDLSRSHVRLSHDNWTTDQWPKVPDRYPTTDPICQLRMPISASSAYNAKERKGCAGCPHWKIRGSMTSFVHKYDLGIFGATFEHLPSLTSEHKQH